MSGWSWPLLLAHRCGGAHAPENTLAGLMLAARLGCRAVEFDVMLSRDKTPVLIHDETLMRTAGLPGVVSGLGDAQLLATDVGRQFHPAFVGEMIPTLEAALATCRHLGLAANVEIKPAAGFEAETGHVVGALLQAVLGDACPEVLLSSFSAEALQAAVQQAPGVPRALLVEKYSPDALVVAQQLGCVSVNMGLSGLEAEHVQAIISAGLRVMVYTVNTQEVARRLVDWGVCGLFSDRPDLLYVLDSEAPFR